METVAAGADRAGCANRKQEIAGEARITSATAGAQNRSSSQPPANRPDRADRPISDVI